MSQPSLADSGASLSLDGRYRFRLWRRWGEGPAVCWIMLNPSTADATQNDPTIRRCVGFTKAWGYGALQVVNLVPVRATDPKELRGLVVPQHVYEANDEHLLSVARAPSSVFVVAGWGRHADLLRGRAAAVRHLLAQAGVALACLGHTRDGHPKHPLYLPANTRLQDYPWEF